MLRRVILTERAHIKAATHLLQSGDRGIESLCFAVWRPSHGAHTHTALIDDILLPEHGEQHPGMGHVSFEQEFLLRALAHAIDQGGGLAFMHSHPSPGWQHMSPADVIAEQDDIAPRTGATDFPMLVGMTIGTDRIWSARFWEKENGIMKKRECHRVNVVGNRFRANFHPRMSSTFKAEETHKRTVSAWGEDTQQLLAQIKFGVVGVGSVGCFVAESLARMGVQDITLIDDDHIKKHNLDRLVHATCEDEGKRKVDFFAERLRKIPTVADVRAIPHMVHEVPGFKAALDCDILFGCVDSQLGRHILNHIAYAHVIPVFEGGIMATPINDKMGRRMGQPHWKTHTVYPGVRCLRCHGQYRDSKLGEEMRDPTYFGENHKDDRNQNVFAFSTHLASTQVLQMLRHVAAPDDTENWPTLPFTEFHYQLNHFQVEFPEACKAECREFPEMTAKGDEYNPGLRSIPETPPETEVDTPRVGFWCRLFQRILQCGSGSGRT